MYLLPQSLRYLGIKANKSQIFSLKVKKNRNFKQKLSPYSIRVMVSEIITMCDLRQFMRL